jgi:hypothetical protein
MRNFARFLVTLVLVTVACGKSTPQGPVEDGQLLVYVYWDGAGLPGKRLEIVELGLEKATNDQGLATFVLPPKSYTLRVYGINTPGPPPLFVERSVTTVAGQTTRIEILDCLPCVTPTSAPSD